MRKNIIKILFKVKCRFILFFSFFAVEICSAQPTKQKPHKIVDYSSIADCEVRFDSLEKVYIPVSRSIESNNLILLNIDSVVQTGQKLRVFAEVNYHGSPAIKKLRIFECRNISLRGKSVYKIIKELKLNRKPNNRIDLNASGSGNEISLLILSENAHPSNVTVYFNETVLPHS